MTDNLRNISLAVIGAYMAEGLFSPHITDNSEHRRLLLDNSPSGHIGIVTDICQYADYALDLCDAAAIAIEDQFPGVWEYEVIDSFGAWYGKRLIETRHQQPTPQQVRVYLANATQEFFLQNSEVDEATLIEAIMSVPFMGGKYDD